MKFCFEDLKGKHIALCECLLLNVNFGGIRNTFKYVLCVFL